MGCNAIEELAKLYERIHFQPTRNNLASNGMAIIGSLKFLENQAESRTATHCHIHPNEPEIRLTIF